jgi:IclR family transcriptional regulator, blcABC operon repressor
VLDGQDVLYVARRDGRQLFQLSSGVGVRLPATCTAVGKVLLANLPGTLAELGVRPPFRAPTDRAHRDEESLLKDLDQVRTRGYAIDDEETSLGVMCFAVYVPEPLGLSAGEHGFAVSATILKATHTEALERDIVEDLRKLSNLITTGPASAEA